MDARDLAGLLAEHASSAKPYLEFLRSGSMSIGLYVIEPGGVDGQSPHGEDEVYVVLAGKSGFTAADEVRDVNTGDVIYVPAGVAHRFHDIVEQLQLVVVFAQPET